MGEGRVIHEWKGEFADGMLGLFQLLGEDSDNAVRFCEAGCDDSDPWIWDYELYGQAPPDRAINRELARLAHRVRSLEAENKMLRKQNEEDEDG